MTTTPSFMSTKPMLDLFNSLPSTPARRLEASMQPVAFLSIRQPAAWLILHGYSKGEQRYWHTAFRGRIYILAPQEIDEDAIDYFQIEFGRKHKIPRFGEAAPTAGLEPVYKGSGLGGIVGIVEVIGCDPIVDPDFPSREGEFEIKFANPTPMDLLPCQGFSGFFPVSLDPYKRKL